MLSTRANQRASCRPKGFLPAPHRETPSHAMTELREAMARRKAHEEAEARLDAARLRELDAEAAVDAHAADADSGDDFIGAESCAWCKRQTARDYTGAVVTREGLLLSGRHSRKRTAWLC